MIKHCPFCQQELYKSGFKLINNDTDSYAGYKYVCTSIACMVNNDFPRYLDVIDANNKIVAQEYALGKFYVKVNNGNSRIYKLISAMLDGEIKIERAFWLNHGNLDETLDKLKLCVTFS